MGNSKNKNKNNGNDKEKYESNTDYYYTDNSNDRHYVNAYNEYASLVNIYYLKSGIYFNKNAQKGLK